MTAACPLCEGDGGVLVVRTPQFRVVRVEGAEGEAFPAFYRLIWNAHVGELSELPDAERQACMDGVLAIERSLRQALAPTKINLASLGNVVPHLHWHVLARFEWDSHFPNPIWGSARREVPGGAAARLALGLPALDARVAQSVSSATREPESLRSPLKAPGE